MKVIWVKNAVPDGSVVNALIEMHGIVFEDGAVLRMVGSQVDDGELISEHHNIHLDCGSDIAKAVQDWIKAGGVPTAFVPDVVA